MNCRLAPADGSEDLYELPSALADGLELQRNKGFSQNKKKKFLIALA
jgi:hypothetical protein